MRTLARAMGAGGNIPNTEHPGISASGTLFRLRRTNQSICSIWWEWINFLLMQKKNKNNHIAEQKWMSTAYKCYAVAHKEEHDKFIASENGEWHFETLVAPITGYAHSWGHMRLAFVHKPFMCSEETTNYFDNDYLKNSRCLIVYITSIIIIIIITTIRNYHLVLVPNSKQVKLYIGVTINITAKRAK